MRTWIFGSLMLLFSALSAQANSWDKEHDIIEVFYQRYSLTAWQRFETVDVYLMPKSVSIHAKTKPEVKVKIFGSYQKIDKNVYFFDPTGYETSGAIEEREGYIICRFLRIKISPNIVTEKQLDLIIRFYQSTPPFQDQNSCFGSGYHPDKK